MTVHWELCAQDEVTKMEEGEGVTSGAAEPVISSAGQMGVQFLTVRLTKMVTGVENGQVM